MTRKTLPKGIGTLVKRGASDHTDHAPDWKGEGAYVVIIQHDGRRHRVRLQATSLTDARREQARLFGSGGSAPAGSGISLGECWRVFLQSSRRRKSGVGAISHYGAFWRGFCTFAGGEGVRASSVNPGTIAGHLRALEKKGLSPSTIAKVRGFLRYIFRVLKADGRITGNPCEGIICEKVPQFRRRELTADEVERVLQSSTGWLRSLLFVGAYTGLRLGDCCSLRWSDIDFSSGVITVTPRKTASSSGAVARIGLTPSLRAELMTLERKGEFVNPHAAEKFQTRSGECELSHAIQDHFHECGITTTEKVPGLKRGRTVVGFHSLRHTWISHQLEQGTPTAVVQLAVGHISPDMTAHYTHATPAILRTMAERGEFGKKSIAEKICEKIQGADDKTLWKIAKLLGILD